LAQDNFGRTGKNWSAFKKNDPFLDCKIMDPSSDLPLSTFIINEPQNHPSQPGQSSQLNQQNLNNSLDHQNVPDHHPLQPPKKSKRGRPRGAIDKKMRQRRVMQSTIAPQAPPVFIPPKPPVVEPAPVKPPVKPTDESGEKSEKRSGATKKHLLEQQKKLMEQLYAEKEQVLHKNEG
jgi:hypothetical protein